METLRTLHEMEAHMDDILESPSDSGTVDMIVSRPETDKREIMDSCDLHMEHGLLGDNWLARGNKHRTDGSADPDGQITIMNTRSINAITDSVDRWPEAGDQFFVDFDLSDENLPPGTHLRIGEAIVEVTALPHLGCKKFGARYGKDANMFVNSDTGKSLNLRGINAKVVQPGSVSNGDSIEKIA